MTAKSAEPVNGAPTNELHLSSRDFVSRDAVHCRSGGPRFNPCPNNRNFCSRSLSASKSPSDDPP